MMPCTLMRHAVLLLVLTALVPVSFGASGNGVHLEGLSADEFNVQFGPMSGRYARISVRIASEGTLRFDGQNSFLRLASGQELKEWIVTVQGFDRHAIRLARGMFLRTRALFGGNASPMPVVQSFGHVPMRRRHSYFNQPDGELLLLGGDRSGGVEGELTFQFPLRGETDAPSVLVLHGIEIELAKLPRKAPVWARESDRVQPERLARNDAVLPVTEAAAEPEPRAAVATRPAPPSRPVERSARAPADEAADAVAAAVATAASRTPDATTSGRVSVSRARPETAPAPTPQEPAAKRPASRKPRTLSPARKRHVERIVKAIRKQWKIPPGPAHREVGVRFQQTGRGDVTHIEIAVSSGDTAFDQSAMMAVLSASPLPKPPAGVPLESDLQLHLRAAPTSTRSRADRERVQRMATLAAAELQEMQMRVALARERAKQLQAERALLETRAAAASTRSDDERRHALQLAEIARAQMTEALALVAMETARAEEAAARLNALMAAGARPQSAKPAAKPAVSSDRPLANGPQMKRLQTVLAKLGFEPGKPDGVEGKRTRAAVRAFEQRYQLRQTGKPTRRVLAEAERRLRSR